jgi:FKBP-type peptidyl-prolyl cis-trans isomerase SlyD
MASQRVFGFHYTVQDEDGEELDSSIGDQALYILEGAEQIVPGLERAIVAMKPGDRRTIALVAADAYGDHDPDLVVQVERSQFPDAALEVGLEVTTDDDPPETYTIVRIEGDMVELDGNHPLAGRDLVFDVEIIEVRPATKDEIAHGHAHGPDGHEHHDEP